MKVPPRSCGCWRVNRGTKTFLGTRTKRLTDVWRWMRRLLLLREGGDWCADSNCCWLIIKLASRRASHAPISWRYDIQAPPNVITLTDERASGQIAAALIFTAWLIAVATFRRQPVTSLPILRLSPQPFILRRLFLHRFPPTWTISSSAWLQVS